MLRRLLLLSLALAGAGWADPQGQFTLELPRGWRVLTDAPPILEGERLRARQDSSGAGFALRSWDEAELVNAGPRLKRALDVESVMSGDRVARLFERDQDRAVVGPTVFLGPAEGSGAAAGRWVYLPPEEPARVWWQVFWRSEGQIQQLVAWCPIASFGSCYQDFTAMEASLRSAYEPRPATLFDSGEERCGAPAHADRAAAIRASSRFGEARALLRAGYARAKANPGALPPEAALRLGELASLDALYRGAEACVHRVARERRVCSVVEGAPRAAQDIELQGELVSCMEEDPALGAALPAAIAPYLGAP